MAEYSADKLIIEIDAKVDNATEKISSLQKQLSSLNKENQISSKLESVYEKLEQISKLSFSNLDDISNKTKESVKNIDKVAKGFANIKKTTIASSKQNAIIPVNEEEYYKSLSILDIIKVKWAEIRGEVKQSGSLITAFKEGLRKSQVYGSALSDKIGGIIKSLKRISFYRIVRALIQLIGKAVKESITNLYSFSDSIGGSFAKSMDSIKTSLTYFINSFATVVSPIIETLEPLITFLLDAIATLNNFIGAFFQGLTGASGITQATKELVKFKQATTSLGIDELNTANQSTGFFSIFGGDGSEESTINQLFSSITQGLQPILDIIGKLGVKIGEVVSKVISLLEPVIEILNSIFDLIGDILNPILDLLDGVLDPIIEVIGTIVSMFKDTLAPAITYVKDILGSFGTYFKEIFGAMITYVKNFLTIWKSVFELVSAIFTGNTEKIQQAWESLWKGIGNFFIAMINGVITGMEAFINLFVNAINAITQAISSIWTWTGIPAIPKIPQASIPRIPYFATGGVVEDGLFMANHNELIGGFSNGKTAVANNEQITTGIYNAVKEALQESGFGNSNSTQQEINVYLDSKEIAKQVNKVNKENGVAIYSGATSYAK